VEDVSVLVAVVAVEDFLLGCSGCGGDVSVLANGCG
jgi:hypothetical protein